ncbi:glycosyl transferase [Sulfurifustis variabilis]|uniref:Glycosyl transferase n=1 Tax=Sulfurifustis variabilis TaxID=1675686 RepID=A0A1B4V3H3_9GAMM|nr:glycosyltransferase family 2 protein [Sulfurifustis variabilis]BAU47915.1 glycosyl transferase [Sulfurifustis variabilis]
MKLVFWTSLVFVAYTYAGYPLLVWALSRLRREPDAAPEAVARWPSVRVIVAVHNEQDRVAAKIANLRELDYPRDKLRIVFVSDGSNDATNDRLAKEADVEVLSYPVRRGKPHALNTAVEAASEEVLVFTDVRQSLAPRALRYLVARLLAPGVGAVSGELVHLDPQTHAAAHIGLYWRYEKWIRKSESRLASNLGVTGALYAIRRVDYKPVPEDTLLDDFEIPMRILRGGKRIVFETRAQVFDELQRSVSGERLRKVRTLTGNFQSFARNPWLFSPLANPVFVQFVSHKVFRLFVPYALALLLVSALLLDGRGYRLAAGAQLAGYAVCALGLAWPRLREHRLVSFLVVFLELNWAAVLALGNFLGGRIDSRWEKT